jgi:hypothetical protein
MNDAVIVQQVYRYFWGDDFAPMLDYMKPRHAEYAKKWNMDYLTVYGNVREDWTRNTGGWAKLQLVKDMLARGYEYVFWIDADCAICDMDTDLRTGAPDGIGMVEHNGPGTPGPHLNVGVMLIRNSDRVRAFMDDWIARYPGQPIFPWFEQGEVHKMKSDPKYAGIIHQIDNKWNSCTYAGTNVPNSAIQAWHGMGNAVQRLEFMKAFLIEKESGNTGHAPNVSREN